jgi:hypothetical protein
MRGGAHGATVVELLVVLGIAASTGLLVLVAGPLQGRLALRAAAAEIVGELRAAQARSIAGRDPDRAYGVVFTVGGDRYAVIMRDGGQQTVLRTRSLPPRVRITYARFGAGPPGTVLFGGVSLFGAPSGGGTVTLEAGPARLCVRVLPATGRVRVAADGCP